MHLERLVHGYLNLAAWLAGGIVLLYALRRVRRDLRETAVPLLGAGALFLLLLQLLSFAVTPQLRAHLCGALLLAMLIGPWLSYLVLAVVMLVQALLLSQGSLLSLGSNVFNLGVVAGIGGYYLLIFCKSLFPHTRRGFLAATAIAAWGSLVAAMLAADFNLVLAGACLGQKAFLLKALLFGLAEALLTVSIIAAILAARPDMVLAYCCGSDKDSCYSEHHHHRTHHH